MRSFVIPIILATTILFSGVFAFIPINEATTVHTLIFANSARLSEDSASTTTAGDDITITCPANSNGCHILEVYVRENDGDADTADFDAANAIIDTITYTISNDLGLDLNNGGQPLPTVSGVAIGAGDTITIAVSGDSDSYSVHVIATVEGNTDIAVTLG